MLGQGIADVAGAGAGAGGELAESRSGVTDFTTGAFQAAFMVALR